MKRFSLLLLLFTGVSLTLFAEEEGALDPAPRAIYPVVEDFPRLGFWAFDPSSSSSLAEAIGFQTPVKSQGSRGTCSIFSATGALESIFKILRGEELDLSENYLEYLVMAKVKSPASPGSDTYWNVPAFQRHGAIAEVEWPYEPADWTSAELEAEERQRAETACGSLMGNPRQACLLSHMSPYEDRFSEKAVVFHRDYSLHRLWYRRLGAQSEVRDLLGQSYPLLLTLEFFYGAWNHRKMETYQIGTRDMDKWAKGIVGVPTANDIYLSRQHGAGHSIIIVGYDDEKRVYYFKNSWGTASFGAESRLLGDETPTAGYGTIAYDYVHSFGTFYDVYMTDESGHVVRRRGQR